MTASEGTFLGLAKQTAFNTPNVTDGDFKYLLYARGQQGPSPIVLPLDPEVGGGAMLRNVVKVGVQSGGQLEFIPRPETLGFFLYGVTGKVTTTGAGPSYSHAFELDADQFAAPYYTARYAPGNLWGEQFQDCRFNFLSLNWRSPDYIRGNLSFLGRTPAKVVTATWNALAQVDGGPQFLTPLGTMELPTATAVKVLTGAFTAVAQIPLDQQYIVGGYEPENLDIVRREYTLSLGIKITDATLYTKIMYDPAGGSAWVADMFREADLNIKFNSDAEADTAIPYSFKIEANGSSGDAANVTWQAQPLATIAQRQIVMNVTGTFLADATLPIKITLVNTRATY